MAISTMTTSTTAAAMTSTFHAFMPSPIGTLLLVGTAEALTGVYISDHDRAPQPPPESVEDEAVLAGARAQLDAYFAGTRQDFDLALEPTGTEFQLAVWQALREVPYGQTASYADIARAIGRPSASRAVGAANGANPISIVVPCHRVIGANGTLTGYGWGVDRKAWLLEHERTVAGTTLFPAR